MSFLSSFFGASGGATRVSGKEARTLVSDGAQLVDVRTPAEFASGHVKGAINIPVSVLPVRHMELDRERAVVVYCRSGGRSASAGSILHKAGFESVHDLGPMSAW
jgi:phage shock protein E